MPMEEPMDTVMEMPVDTLSSEAFKNLQPVIYRVPCVDAHVFVYLQSLYPAFISKQTH